MLQLVSSITASFNSISVSLSSCYVSCKDFILSIILSTS
nr:MAG TPA: hypothetical protein [Caudoviricetes sp.]